MSENSVILLVEDNADDVELARRAFDKCHITSKLVVAGDGQEALDYLFKEGLHEGREATVMPNLVLLDLNLPKLSGLEVLRRLRADKRTRCLPVVVLTTSVEDRDIINSYDLGANSYVRKPVDFAQFLEAAKQLGVYWLELNRAPPGGGTR